MGKLQVYEDLRRPLRQGKMKGTGELLPPGAPPQEPSEFSHAELEDPLME